MLLFSLSINANGQENTTNTLPNEQNNTLQDSSRVDELLREARFKIRTDFEGAMANTVEALAICEKLPYDSAKAYALRTRADLYTVSGLHDQATQDALASLELARAIGDRPGEAYANATIGTVHFYLGATDQALEFYNKALDIHLETGNIRGAMSVRNNIGSALGRARRFEEALPIYKTNLDSMEHMGQGRFLGVTLNNIGAIYQSLLDHKSALPYFVRAEKFYSEAADSMGLAGVYGNLCEAYMSTGNPGRAKIYLNKLEHTARASGSTARMMSVYEVQSSYYSTVGQHERALSAYTNYVKLKDSLSQAGQQDKVDRLRTAFETEKKLEKITAERDMKAMELDKEMAESARTEAELSNTTTLRNAFITGFGLVLVFSVLLVRGNQKRSKANEILRHQKQQIEEKHEALEQAREKILHMNEQLKAANLNLESLVRQRTSALRSANEELTQANEDLDTFIYRASHDLRGPIARLKGLAQVAALQGRESPIFTYIDKMNIAAVRMDRVLKKLILVRELPATDLEWTEVDLQALVSEVAAELQLQEDIDALVPEFTGPNLSCRTDRTRLAVVLENVLENAWFYRRPATADSAQVKVSFRETHGTTEIVLEDHGEGIALENQVMAFELFFRGSHRSPGNGMGLFLAELLVQQMGGTMSLESEPDAFTRVTIRLNPVES
ncbi:MAG: tetratricopeptide repeat protein [Bacteroidota bacterium]